MMINDTTSFLVITFLAVSVLNWVNNRRLNIFHSASVKSPFTSGADNTLLDCNVTWFTIKANQFLQFLCSIIGEVFFFFQASAEETTQDESILEEMLSITDCM